MEKKFDDDEWKKFLEEEYIKEADLMEEALFSDEDFPDMEMTDEEVNASFDRLMDRLKADGVYREEPKEEKAKEDATKDEVRKNEVPKEAEAKVVELKPAKKKKKSMPLVTRHKLAKIAGFVVMCTLTVFAASMTSEANRHYFVSTFDYLVGNDTQVILGNDEKNEDPEMNEEEAREDIRKTLGIKMPEFWYFPDTFGYKGYEIGIYNKFAYLEYNYQDGVIALFARKYDEKDKSVNFNLHGEEIGTFYISDLKIPVSILEVKDEKDICSSYAAQWNWDGTFFQISGKMEKEKFVKLIEKMKI